MTVGRVTSLSGWLDELGGWCARAYKSLLKRVRVSERQGLVLRSQPLFFYKSRVQDI